MFYFLHKSDAEVLTTTTHLEKKHNTIQLKDVLQYKTNKVPPTW